jgi:hypothetical protein
MINLLGKGIFTNFVGELPSCGRLVDHGELRDRRSMVTRPSSRAAASMRTRSGSAARSIGGIEQPRRAVFHVGHPRLEIRDPPLEVDQQIDGGALAGREPLFQLRNPAIETADDRQKGGQAFAAAGSGPAS